MAEAMLRDAAAFAKSYTPQDGEHPDLESRVAMYRRAVKSGDKRRTAAHARTLVRFARNVGRLEVTSSSSTSSDGPTKAELQAEAESLGLSKSGSKGELQARIAAERERLEAEGNGGS